MPSFKGKILINVFISNIIFFIELINENPLFTTTEMITFPPVAQLLHLLD